MFVLCVYGFCTFYNIRVLGEIGTHEEVPPISRRFMGLPVSLCSIQQYPICTTICSLKYLFSCAISNDETCETIKPVGRASHGSAYDTDRKRIWIFGGYTTYYPYLRTDGSGSGEHFFFIVTFLLIVYVGFLSTSNVQSTNNLYRLLQHSIHLISPLLTCRPRSHLTGLRWVYSLPRLRLFPKRFVVLRSREPYLGRGGTGRGLSGPRC